MMKFNNCITSSENLVTSHAQTRAGFIEAALEKNRKSKPYIEEAKTLKQLASKASKATDLLSISAIRSGLLTASGLSDKSLKYFTEIDKTEAIKKLIEEFLEPSGKDFIDELVYRFFAYKGRFFRWLNEEFCWRSCRNEICAQVTFRFIHVWCNISSSFKKK